LFNFNIFIRLLCVSTQVPAFLNGLRLGFIEVEIKVFDKRILCAESIYSISLSNFGQRWLLEAFASEVFIYIHKKIKQFSTLIIRNVFVCFFLAQNQQIRLISEGSCHTAAMTLECN